ncbi:MAG TPA: ATP-binding cassette domain-containing protein [Acidimicrobiia bacterium]|jgi:ABC-2 type transport system ATP-binding protein|nr:ATP-binding cassette domain-containing protein [Acidimicrobiia bacterium]
MVGRAASPDNADHANDTARVVSAVGAVIEVEGLAKTYRRRSGRFRALDGVDLSVPAGGVYGFLGPNGAGKTTTIRCLLGLSRPTAGSCRLLGADAPRALPTVIARVGSLVETPGLNSGLTGRQALTVLATSAGLGRTQVDHALERVGLATRADDLARGYSLGMRQRLGLAIALLKDPEVLILDEPANGLDPAGIREIRELVRDLRTEGRTVFLSSHLLGEIEQVCDRVAILAAGRTVIEGPIDEVLAAARPKSMWVKVRDLDGGTRSLAAAGLAARVDDGYVRVDVEPDQGETVARVLVADGLYPSELRPVEATLEDAFFALTGEARS